MLSFRSQATLPVNLAERTPDELLQVSGLQIAVGQGAAARPLVHDVSFALQPGRITGLIGESGSGKSMIAKSILGMLPEGVHVAGGEITFDGASLLSLDEGQWQRMRGAGIGAVFQDPLSSLNPVLKIREQLLEGLRAHGAKGDLEARAVDLLARVGIPDPAARLDQYPHEFSGGMRQRVCIAMAIANGPRLLIADEPTTAVDMTVQARIIETLKALQAEMGLAILMITHDMGLVSRFCDDVVVMQNGRVVETGPTEAVLSRPSQAYTRDLIAAVPEIDQPAPVPQALRPQVLAAHDIVTRVGPRGAFWKADGRPAAVDGITLSVAGGETLGLVGESGCGKTTLARTIAGFLTPAEGGISVGQENLFRSVQYVFQDPYASLNPRMSIRQSLAEAFRLGGVPAAAQDRRAASLMEAVGLDAAMLDRKPTHFSGGQRQRIVIARALAASPEVLVCDEAVSALDVSVQAHVLDLLRQVQATTGVGIVFISHDLAVVKTVSHRTAVMYLGQIIEIGPTDDIFDRPLHPYTTALLSAVPTHPWNGRPELALLGETPRPGAGPSGCRFRDRCPVGPLVRKDRALCASEVPELTECGPAHFCACHYPGELQSALSNTAQSERN